MREPERRIRRQLKSTRTVAARLRWSFGGENGQRATAEDSQMEKMETILIWITLGLVAVLVVLQAAEYRKSRSKQSLIMVIGYVLIAATQVVLLAMRYSK